MKITYALHALVCMTAFAATAATPAPTLQEKLQGKTPAEKQEVLRLACLNEAEHIGNPPVNPFRHQHYGKIRRDASETRQMKDLCHLMNKYYVGKSS